MGKIEIEKFLLAHNIDVSIFDGIYVSCDYKKTKENGDLYFAVIDTENIDLNSVEMYGDNKIADYEKAKQCGIPIVHLRQRLLHKTWLKGKFVLKYNFGKYAPKKIIRFCRMRGLCFSEYLQLYYAFAQRLSLLCEEQTIYFLSREGYFLKKIFEQVEYYNNGEHKTEYLLCSRESTKNAENNERQAFIQYMNEKGIKNGDAIVDIGWKGTMQLTIEDILNIKLKGYYLGLNGDPNKEYKIDKKGLVFYENMGPAYHILKSNIQLYEQLAAAPHGSPRHYIKNNDHIDVDLEWPNEEQFVYEKTINNIQQEMLLLAGGIAAWNRNKYFSDEDNFIAVLRSGLFANKGRIDFLRLLDNTFVWNFGETTVGTSYNSKSVKLGVNIFYAPEEYCRYMVKLQRFLKNNSILNVGYYILAAIYFCYTIVLVSAKQLMKKERKSRI